jgi:hypothetical protein
MSFGQHLRTLRDAAGLSRAELARRAGVPAGTLRNWKGKPLVTSGEPKGNVGYPAQPHEIERFLAMLKQTARKMGPGQLDQIGAALRQARKDLGLDSRN